MKYNPLPCLSICLSFCLSKLDTDFSREMFGTFAGICYNVNKISEYNSKRLFYCAHTQNKCMYQKTCTRSMPYRHQKFIKDIYFHQMLCGEKIQRGHQIQHVRIAAYKTKPKLTIFKQRCKSNTLKTVTWAEVEEFLKLAQVEKGKAVLKAITQTEQIERQSIVLKSQKLLTLLTPINNHLKHKKFQTRTTLKLDIISVNVKR